MPRSMRPYLEYQADRVEAVLAAHRAPGRITGGTVGPRLIRFFLNPAPHIRYAAIKRLSDDLALAMQVPTLTIDKGKEGVILEFAHPNPQSVSLMNLLGEAGPLPFATALLGLTDDGAPLLSRFSAPEVAHVLVSGTTGSGKSALLRTIAASLVLSFRPDLTQLVCIDMKNRTFKPLASAPHLVRPAIDDAGEAIEALHSLFRMIEWRDRKGILPASTSGDGVLGNSCPRTIVFIDELADLVMAGGKDATETITRIAQRGREAGVHLIAATQHPSSAILGSVMRANFPLRLVGQVVSADDARVASGRAGTNAHLLNGRGDFLAVAGGDRPIRFQVAYIEPKDLLSHVKRIEFAGSVSNDLPVYSLDDQGGMVEIERNAATESGQGINLLDVKPVKIEPEPKEEAHTASAITAAAKMAKHWPSVREAYFDGKVNKSKLCRSLWPSAKRYEGRFATWLDEAVGILEADINSATSTATAAPGGD